MAALVLTPPFDAPDYFFPHNLFFTVHTNFHAKSGVCSSRNEWVMLNFEIWRQFCFLAAIMFFKKKSKFVQTVHTNFHAKSGLCSARTERVMHNFFDLVAILFFKKLSKFVQTVHINFHAKSRLCSSINEWVMLHLVFGTNLFHCALPCLWPTYI